MGRFWCQQYIQNTQLGDNAPAYLPSYIPSFFQLNECDDLFRRRSPSFKSFNQAEESVLERTKLPNKIN